MFSRISGVLPEEGYPIISYNLEISRSDDQFVLSIRSFKPSKRVANGSCISFFARLGWMVVEISSDNYSSSASSPVVDELICDTLWIQAFYLTPINFIEPFDPSDRFRDRHQYDYELLLSKLDLPEDLELHVVPEPPSEELELPPEEDDEVVQNPDAHPNPADLAEPMSDAAPDAQE
ncbi:hypothetical protein RHMOL_Rhmol01G0190900 [Rhododendron molle]|uniref:Uncharacterized protein n=1 Tax=Rhododendron molle TaxID=49168 RepID=A0ACC0Q514_RHOML|nr:hypothetical protein RHMOL_Rhmol01G0190900 [Rhododendron molle]